MKSIHLSRELSIVIITAIGVVFESIFFYHYLDVVFPNLKQIGNLETLFVEIGMTIFLTVTVYEYSSKSERFRKNRLRMQIISSFEMLSADFAWLSTQKVSQSINEEFITKKNLRIFHIQNLIGVLPDKLGTDLALQIPEFCEKALQIPRIVRPLDSTKPIVVDYTNCDTMMKEISNLLQNLQGKWKIPKNLVVTETPFFKETDKPSDDKKLTFFWKKTENKLLILSIIVALVIGGPTIYLGWETGLVLEQIKEINKNQFTIQNFRWELIGNVEPLVLENRLYNNESLNQKLSLSITSPHYLKIVVTSVEIQNDDQSKKLPQVYLEASITRVLPSGVSNIDINAPIRLNFDPKLNGYDVDNSTSSLGEIRYNFEITNIQTKEPITNGFVHSSVTLE
ncbi:hypothetical protein [Candidatus Nitrosotenuis cloacae]|uniref:Uncharacterized protein n=1 Tax=Candidatus Nitrosotenuis cloacae TaxID=1603555 RepID=A0A3G1B1W3_9ARCH|nr:hypothetical protein [Candidatus Nitrosotenuis cloacae]AJZ75634.1 hypothetical protein SU86_003795 [Candidatus Nitrosotenuis cloacae]